MVVRNDAGAAQTGRNVGNGSVQIEQFVAERKICYVVDERMAPQIGHGTDVLVALQIVACTVQSEPVVAQLRIDVLAALGALERDGQVRFPFRRLTKCGTGSRSMDTSGCRSVKRAS